MREFIAGLPKTELHVHIEGTFEPELMFAIASRNGIELPYADVTALREAYAFSNLQSFLDIYYQGANALITEQDFFELTEAYLRRARAENIRHVEIFCDPQTHTARGVDVATVLRGVHGALSAARADYGVSFRLIPCFLRHLPESDALNTLAAMQAHLDLVDGVGLDSSERDHPPGGFARVFARARELGLHAVAHAGEEGPVAYIREAIDELRVERIDHGVRCESDHGLVAELARSRMPLTVCPLSNIKLRVFADMRQHNIARLLDAGLCVTVNSDDPAYFGGYLNANFMAVVDGLGLSRESVAQLARNGIEASFIDAERRAALTAELDDYLASAV